MDVTGRLTMRKHHLPHWQRGGSVYFVTFRSARGLLPEMARAEVVRCALHRHGISYDVIFGVAMPDHVHLVLRPRERSPGTWYDLSRIMKGIKGVSARSTNRALGTRGSLWQPESFDRIVRDQREFEEKLKYMLENPVRAGLVSQTEDYRFYILPDA